MTGKVMRVGKTTRDKKSGAWGNRFANRTTREDWQKSSNGLFPKETCNGKKNRLKK